MIGNCEDCKETSNNLHLHHKDRNHSNNKEGNKKYLCPSCHGKEHGFEGVEISSEFHAWDLTNDLKRGVGFRITEGFKMLEVED